jgi:putative membrane protein
MKKQFSFFTLLCLLAALSSCNDTANNQGVENADSANARTQDTNTSGQSNTGANTVNQETSDFMMKVADGGMAEVQMGQAAKDKARNQRVKNFATMMVDDHSKANDELKSLASQKSVTLPSGVSEDHKKHLNDLTKKSANDFDKSYMKMMVDDHQKTVDEFEKASRNTSDAQVKAWVEKTLPVLRMHLDSAKAINNSLK